MFRFLAKQYIALARARTSAISALLRTFMGIAVAPQVAIGITPGNSKPARSEESCRGQCQRRHLHPTARSRSILHHRPRRAPEQLPTQLTFQIFLTPGYAWLSVDLIKLKRLPASLNAEKACIWILSACICMCCAILHTSNDQTYSLRSVRSRRSMHKVQ